MGRNCGMVFDDKSCRSGFPDSKYDGKLFSFPSNNIDRKHGLTLYQITSTQKMDGYLKDAGNQGGVKKPVHMCNEFGTTPHSDKFS